MRDGERERETENKDEKEKERLRPSNESRVSTVGDALLVVARARCGEVHACMRRSSCTRYRPASRAAHEESTKASHALWVTTFKLFYRQHCALFT